jgi:glycosyltransferase involved in cell wall biosynthesis
MNILFYSSHSAFTEASVGGAETSMRLIAERLAKLDYRVYYLTSDPDATEVYSEEKIDGVTVIRYAFPWMLSGNAGIGKKFFIDAYPLWIKILLLEVLTEKQIDLVYVYYQLHVLEPLLEVRKKYNLPCPVVMRMAGLFWYEQIKTNPLLKERFESVFNEVDSVNHISEGLQDAVHEIIGNEAYSISFLNEFAGDIGVDPVFLEGKRDVPQSYMKILVATRFANYAKRQDLVLEAVKLLNPHIPIHLTLVGDGPTRAVYQQMVDDLGLNDVVEIKPRQRQDDLWVLMDEADLLCHPCDYEGLSKIIIESMMRGLPVCASNVVPLANYIKDGENGYLVDNTAEAWAHKIEYIYLNKDRLPQIRRTAHEFAKQSYNSKENAVLYAKEFDRLIKRSGRRHTEVPNCCQRASGDVLKACAKELSKTTWSAIPSGIQAREEYWMLQCLIKTGMLEKTKESYENVFNSTSFRLGSSIVQGVMLGPRALKGLYKKRIHK